MMIRTIFLVFVATSLSSCTKVLSPFVKFHPQQSQDFSDYRAPSQNSIAAMQAEDPRSGIVVVDPQSIAAMNGTTHIHGWDGPGEAPKLDPIVVRKYDNKHKTFYQLNNSSDIESFVQVVEVKRDLKNPPRLNYQREEIAKELMMYKSNYMASPSEDFFSAADPIPQVNDPYKLPENLSWRHHKPYYYDSKYHSPVRPYYLSDTKYVQQPEKIPNSKYTHYPKMLSLEEEIWAASSGHTSNYYGGKAKWSHKNYNSVSAYEKFFSIGE